MSWWKKILRIDKKSRAEGESTCLNRCPRCQGKMTLNPVNLVPNEGRIALDNGLVPELINCPLWTCSNCGYTRKEPPVKRAPRPMTFTQADIDKYMQK